MFFGLRAASTTPARPAPSREISETNSLLARLLETGQAASSLESSLRRGEAADLNQAFSRLPLDQQSRIRETWSFAAEEILELGRENEPELRDEALLQIAGRLENHDRLPQAAAIYESLAASEGSANERARLRLGAMNGVGDSGARAEFLARRFIREVRRPEMLIGMGAAGLAFRLTRLAATARLAGSLGGGLRLSAAANSLGFLAETLAFTGAIKISGAALGVTQDWSAPAIGREWASGALSLFGLKAMGSLSGAALGRWARGGGSFEAFTRAALPQAAMLGGITLGHHLEERAGLREHRDGATNLIDSLALLLQFNVVGRLLHGITGPGARSFEVSVDARTRAIAASPIRLADIGASIFRGPRLAPSGAGLSGDILWMSGEGGGSQGPSISFSEGRSVEASSSEAKPTAAEPVEEAPITQREPLLDPQTARYHLPRTKYFDELRQTLTFEGLVGYARAVQRAQLVGVNLRNTLQVPMVGPEEYSPYGAALVEHLRENPEAVHTLTGKNERALIASPGTAILGLGAAEIGPDMILQAEAADAIMQGKAKYFLTTAGVSATPLCVRSYFSSDQRRALEAMEPRQRAEQARIWRAERFAETVLSIAPNFGFINIEDAQGKDLPLIFGVLESLRGNTALWSDDMQGTGIITAAAMLGWSESTGRLDARGGLGRSRGIIFGAGAGAMGVYDELLNNGMLPENILVTDSRGPLHAGRRDVERDPYKLRMLEGIPEGMTVESFARGADFLVNLGVKETLTDDPGWTAELIRSLGENPFVGVMTNPEPGITPGQLRQIRTDAYYGSGNQTHENAVNNFTAFGYIGAGALMARARSITPAMTVAAARGIFEVAKLGAPEEWRDRLPAERREFGRHWLVPRHDDLRLIAAEAGAVAKAAARDGVAMLLGPNPNQAQLGRFDREVDEQVAMREWTVSSLREGMPREGRRYLAARYPQRYAPFRIEAEEAPLFEVAPEIRLREFEYFAGEMGLEGRHWSDLLNAEGEFRPTVFPEVLERLRPESEDSAIVRDLAQREIRMIAQLATISPPLGLALALRRSRVRSENLERLPTVFHREAVLRSVLQLIPEAQPALEREFPDLPPLPE